MTIKISNIVWHDASLMSPAKDGVFLAEIGYAKKEVGTLHYTTEGGWNSLRKDDGTTTDGWGDGNGYVSLWADMPKIEGVTINDSAE